MKRHQSHKSVQITVRAFSLIEILVVVAILAVLALLMIPMFNNIVNVGHSTQCVANLRACAQGIFLHAEENSGKLILPWASASERDLNNFPELVGHSQSGLTWYEFLTQRGYLSTEVLVCPSFTPHQFSIKPWGETYGMRRTDDGNRYKAIILAAQAQPSRFVLLADSSRPMRSQPTQWYYVTWRGNSSDTMHFRHNDRVNILFLDGSVRGLTADQVLNLDDGWRVNAFDLKTYN